MSADPNARTSGALRDYLLKTLSSHPGTREFHLHTLVTAPRKSSSLYPFATPRPPRSYMQDILILLSEQPAPDVDDSAPDNRPPRVMVSAIEATLYVLPSTLCSVLYVCKVDSTGQAAVPSPTALLVRSLLRFYLDPKTRPIPQELTRHLYLHIFARAQAQYLFSASKEWPGKKPLNDTKLCAWWKRCVSRVVADLAADEARNASGSNAPAEGLKMKLYYVLPSLAAFEAEHSLRIAGPPPPPLPLNLQWTYGHPYNSDDDSIPLPCPPPPDTPLNANNKRPHSSLNLGCYIPYFDDDPKSRFIDEIAHTTDGEIKSPQLKKRRTALDVVHKSRRRRQDDDVMPSLVGSLNAPTVVVTAEDEDAAKEEDEEREKEKEAKQAQSLVPLGELGKVTPDEFWERMSFRQECIAGAITGFFTVVVSSPSTNTPSTHLPPNPLTPQPGQVPAKLNKRIMKILLEGVEFSTFESAAKSTQTIESAIRGLCDGVPPVLPVTTSSTGVVPPSASSSTPTTSNILGIPINIRQRSTTPEPDASRNSGSQLLAAPQTPPRRTDAQIEVSPNPFPEVVASKDTYDVYIYGSVVTRNPVKEVPATTGEPGSAAGTGVGTEQSPSKRPVTVLAVRKKVKKKTT
ncbi:hypothetical protein D9619_007313 [Psilocybe cf. subviscida]|uniref:histone acetyltransferase n=1 Tax=Psilocybe cf. subviscida TaxID=2480587 RepID=A0A8H5EX96_9AGAR|nr:hypothetical protein D9619_007313 [Psilocybe cf. subviscida]